MKFHSLITGIASALISLVPAVAQPSRDVGSSVCAKMVPASGAVGVNYTYTASDMQLVVTRFAQFPLPNHRYWQAQ